MIPGKLYRLSDKNSKYVFNNPATSKAHYLNAGDILLFVKKQQMPDAFDGTGPYANPYFTFTFLYEDIFLEAMTTEPQIRFLPVET